MNKGIRLPVRPAPVTNESFIGYCLRLAKVNGRLHINELNKALGLSFSKYQFCVGHGKFDAYLEKLAPMLLRDTDDLVEHFFEYQNLELVDSKKRMIQSLTCSKPKICVHCLSEGKGLQADWLYLHNTHCDIHQVALMDVCPECGEPFDWKTSLMNGCDSCEESWSECSLPHSSTPVYQKILDDALKQDNQSLLDAFYAVFAVTLRPNDFIINRQTRLDMPNKESHQRHLQAYALIHSPLYARQWAKEYEKAGHLTPFLHGNPLLHFIKQTSELFGYPVEINHRYSHTRDENESAIRPYRNKVAERIPLSRHVGLLEAATFLGIDAQGLGRLLDQHIVLPIHESYFLTDTLFDLESLIEVDLKVWGKSKQPQNKATKPPLVPVMDLFPALEAFCLSPATLLAICLKEPEIPFYSVGGTHWYELSVNKTEFFEWLEDIYLQHIPDEISVADFKKMTGTDEKQCRELVRSTSLSFKPWVKSDVISDKTLIEFFESFSILGRFLKLYEMDGERTMSALYMHDIEPFYEPRKGESGAVYNAESLNLRNFHVLRAHLETKQKVA